MADFTDSPLWDALQDEHEDEKPVEYVSGTPQARRWVDLPNEYKPSELLQMPIRGSFMSHPAFQPGGGLTPSIQGPFPEFNPATSQLGLGTVVAGAGRVLGGGAVGSIGRWLGLGGAAAAGGAAMEALVGQDGEIVDVRVKKRRRRRRMLTCSDKADIAFLRGTLGGGELGKSAITAMLTSRCGR